MYLILYSKPGCHLCEELQEKLEQITSLNIELEIRDITSREDWFEPYQYEVPLLFYQEENIEKPIPRPSPRASIKQLIELLEQYI